jgi:hypothetical protein
MSSWQTTTDAHVLCEQLFPMHSLGSAATQPRKLRLYLCALMRSVWPKLPPVMQTIVAVAEAYADSPLTLFRETKPVARLAEEMLRFDGVPDDIQDWTATLRSAGWPCAGLAFDAGHFDAKEWNELAIVMQMPFREEVPPLVSVDKSRHCCETLREIFYHSRRQLKFQTDWCSDCVTDLATSIYRSRDFTSMPILADLLEEAGCRQTEILNHCRRPVSSHVRGCWVIDSCLASLPETQRTHWGELDFQFTKCSPSSRPVD